MLKVKKLVNFQCTYTSSLQRHLDVIQFGNRTPTLGNQAFLREINIEQVESVINSLDFACFRHPHSHILGGRNQHTVPVILCLAQNGLQILYSSHDANRHFATLLRCVWAWIKGSVETFADLLDTRLQLLALEENNENAFVDSNSSVRIDQRLGNFGLAQENVATARTPQKSLKGRQTLTLNDTGDKPRNEELVNVVQQF
jgi:hypothetical protein